MGKSTLFCVIAIAMVALLNGCNRVLNENDPVSIARSFWTAALSTNPNDAKQFMVKGDSLEIGIRGYSDKDTALLGEVDQQNGYYFIQTTIQLLRDGKIISVPMRTVVVPVEGRWRVDYWSTKQSVFDAAFDSSMKWFSSTLRNADQYIDDILGTEDKKEALDYAEERLNIEFDKAKSAILKNYKAQIEKQDNSSAPEKITQPGG
ncbi:hypothetical protein [Microbulbifer epialgicus]|uniref:DUF4468 domain-containing protein n=1 Tax=Microbulbifer epialgicus TaxID=393907 RepID=A0ABV4NTL8_9GAMM